MDEYLNEKRFLKSVRKYEERLRFARDKFQNWNIKDINSREIKGFFNELIEHGHSYTYRRLISEAMKAFYNWINDDEEIKIPKFPKFNKKNMAWRKIVRKPTQLEILYKVRELTYDINPRIYIGILFLITYISLRPKEIIGLKEKNIDFENCWILVGDKNSELEEAKHVPILPEHLILLKKEMRKHPSHPNLHFL